MTGWFVLGIAKKFTTTFPALQMVVLTARPTWVPSLPNCSKCPRSPISPVMVSGPGLKPSGSALRCAGSRISRVVAQEQKQQERDVTQYLLKHNFDPFSKSPFKKLHSPSLRTRFPRFAGFRSAFIRTAQQRRSFSDSLKGDDRKTLEAPPRLLARSEASYGAPRSYTSTNPTPAPLLTPVSTAV